MKTIVYNSFVSNKSNTLNCNRADVTIKRADVSKAIQERHKNWQTDNRETRRELKRVYADWYQVYRRRTPAERIVMQSQVDTLSKMEAYLAPIFVAGEFCQITTSENRSADALRSKVSEKTGKTHYIVPVRWTVSALETAVKYCAKYYAGVEVDLEAKFDSIK